MQSRQQVDPYFGLAEIYDDVMFHVDYARWANYLRNSFQKADIPVIEVLDLACGTGSIIMELAKASLSLTGADKSFEMVRRARKKARSKGYAFPFLCSDMTKLCLQEEFDAVVCTYDSFNYCLSPDACVSVFENVARCLRQGGLFVFDVCTQKNSRHYFRHYSEDDSARGVHYTRRSRYLTSDQIQINEFSLLSVAGETTEIHRQRIYRLSEIREMIPAERFETVGLYDGFSFRKASERSDRVHFVLKRS